jgi:hypothetical protein
VTHGRIFIVTLAALLALGSACGGDDDDTEGTKNGKDAGGDEAGKTGGSSGKGGSSGGDQDASTGGGGTGSGGGGTGSTTKDAGGLTDEDGGTVELCGSTTCAAPECCADPFVSKCGLQVNARACLPPQMSTAMSDSRCPSVAVMGGAFMIPSCCTDDGKCGINAAAAGMGCIALETVIMYTMTQGGAGMGIDWPEPQTCD